MRQDYEFQHYALQILDFSVEKTDKIVEKSFELYQNKLIILYACINWLIYLKKFMLSKSETSELLDKLHSMWPGDIVPKVKTIKAYEVEEDKRLLFADEIIAVQIHERIVPFLGMRAEALAHFPSVTVDMGAIRFVCNGAKIMRPGITNFDSFRKDQIVLIRDETHLKALAVGLALEDSEAAKGMRKGYVIDNLHHISDKMWEAYKEI